MDRCRETITLVIKWFRLVTFETGVSVEEKARPLTLLPKTPSFVWEAEW